MDQVYGGNYQSYQPSYNSYGTPSSGQWAGYGYNQGAAPNASYNYDSGKMSESPYESYNRNTYSSTCMGQCNPPKLYADTYNYLTENLMKPVIEEVYRDLKSITAANTVANNAAASKMGLQTPAQPTEGQGHQQGVPGQTPPTANDVRMSNGVVQGQLNNVSVEKPISQYQNQSMPQNTAAMRSQVGSSGYTQQIAATGRNGLMEI